MKPVDRQSLRKFKSLLAKEKSSDVICVGRDTVKDALDEIADARKRRVSWERIAELLAQSTHLKLTGNTVRRYYYEVVNGDDVKQAQKSSSRLSTASQKQQRSSRSKAPSHPVLEEALERDSNSEVAVNVSQPDVEELAHPDSGSSGEQSTSMSERTSQNGSFSHWQEPEFNVNRVRPPVTEASQN
ncbi:MAG TPA: hypothetical protein V6D19_23065 [Stenomitos sp.]